MKINSSTEVVPKKPEPKIGKVEEEPVKDEAVQQTSEKDEK